MLKLNFDLIYARTEMIVFKMTWNL